jgi:hypothetical protein
MADSSWQLVAGTKSSLLFLLTSNGQQSHLFHLPPIANCYPPSANSSLPSSALHPENVAGNDCVNKPPEWVENDCLWG